MVRSALALLAVVLASLPATAAPPDEQEAVARVNRAIDKGKEYLKSRYQPDNKWESFWISNLGSPGGVTALVTLALLTCGERPDVEPVRSALDYLRGLPPEKTYVVALVTMALAEARLPADRTRIAANARWLIDTALRQGNKIIGWGYPYPKSVGGTPDGSNTQYALLGLYAAKQVGVEIEDGVWQQIRDAYAASQKTETPTTGYWHYMPGKNSPSFTMTAAGVSGLVIAGMALGDDQQKLDPATGVAANCGRYAENDQLAKGMNWLGRRFNWAGKPNDLGTWYFYNVYGIERVGRLSGQRFIGRVDWYRDGCAELTRNQRPDGSWTRDDGFSPDAVPVLATSFSLLFLSKGRTPVLVSKLAHGDSVMQDGVLIERAEPGGVVGWNRKHNDARNLTDFASRELFNGLPLGWQVYDPRRRPFDRVDDILAEVGTLVQSPVLYLNGHRRPVLNGQQKEIVKRYIEEGGFVLGEACCGSTDFAAGFRALMEELFPDNALKPMPPEHPIWQSFYAVPPTEFPRLECLERGCRTVVVFSPEPLAGYWEDVRYMPKGKTPAADRGQQAYRLAGNVIAYATGMEPPKQKLWAKRIVDGTNEKTPPGGFVKPVQLRLRDEPPPAPAALRNLAGHLRDAIRLDVAIPDKEDARGLPPGHEDLFKFRFLYMHGRKSFTFAEDEMANVKATLLGGGVLFADACCGSPAFDASFRELAAKMFPDKKLELIPDNDDLYSERLGGTAIRTVKRREKTDGTGPDGGFKDLPPYLEGVKVDGRWVLIYSKFDVGCALEGHKATDCLGHTRESALQLTAAAVLYSLKR